MNWKVLFILVFFIPLGIFIFHTFSPHKSVLSSHDGYKDFTLKYYFGVDVDMSQLLPTSKYYIVNNRGEDLIDIAARLGINTFRIMNYTAESKYAYTQQEWDTVLRKMNHKGIKAIILVEGPITDPKFRKDTEAHTRIAHLQSYVIDTDLCNNPDVFAMDLINEPNLTSDNLDMIRTEATMVKAKCPQTKVTIGGWKTDTYRKDFSGNEVYEYNNPEDSVILKDLVDFYAFHLYGFDRKGNGVYPDPYTFAVKYIKSLKQYGGNKPILIEEFGAGNGEAITDQITLGSKELQTNAYEGVLRAAYNQHIMGATAYIFYPRSSHPEGWTLLNNQGNDILPAAYTFQKFISLAAPQTKAPPQITLIPQIFILGKEDSNTTLYVHKNDIIGLHLFLDTAEQYTIHADNTVLSMTESLVQYSSTDPYDAVFHAISSGTTTITISQNNQFDVFKATIIVL